MAIKDILVHLDGSSQAMVRLDVAAELARRHNAHLAGLFIIDLMAPAMLAGDGNGTYMVAELLETMRQEALAQAATVQARFQERLRRDGIAGEWRLVEGFAPGQVALQARYADLLVAGQADPEVSDAGEAIVEQAIFSSGRPVLVVPNAGRFGVVGRRVVVGWNASPQAARALHDALPLIEPTARVKVIAVNPQVDDGSHGEQPGADIARHLARHDLKVEVERISSDEVTDGECLLNAVADEAADLLVLGAFGHSRFREFILGGVTRTMLQEMTVPVLLAH